MGMVLPRKNKAKKGDTTRAEAQNVPQNTSKEIVPLTKPALKEKARAITAEEKAFSAKDALRTAWANKHYDGRKRKRAAEKAEAAEAKKGAATTRSELRRFPPTRLGPLRRCCGLRLFPRPALRLFRLRGCARFFGIGGASHTGRKKR